MRRSASRRTTTTIGAALVATGLAASLSAFVSIGAAGAAPIAGSLHGSPLADISVPPHPGVTTCPPGLTCSDSAAIFASGIAPAGSTSLTVLLVPPVATDDADMPTAALGPDDKDPAAEQPVGSAFDLTPLSDTSVDLSTAYGDFTISAPPASVPDGYIGNDGLVDMQILANGSGHRSIEERSVRLARPVGGDASDAYWVDPGESDDLLVDEPASTGSDTREDLIPELDTSLLADDEDAPGWSRGADADADSTSAAAAIAAADASPADDATTDDPGTETDATGGPSLESWAQLPDASTAAAASPDTVEPPYPCEGEELSTYHHVMASIGSSYTEGNSVGHREWVDTQTTTTGIAFSASGTYGDFSADGSKSFSRGTSTGDDWTWPAETGVHRYEVQVSYHKYRYACQGITYYEYRPVMLTGGTGETSGGTVPGWSACVPNALSQCNWSAGSA